MKLPFFNALNRFSTNSPILSWLVYCGCLFAGFFVLSYEQIRAAEDFWHAIGELVVASSILATVLYLIVRHLVVWFLDKE
jgi:protein-S-isoprenylcysteine O-methyltransferase Ste14